MVNFKINYPLLNYRDYIECIYEFCKYNRFSMILKGSLAEGTATKFSDIDLIVLGNMMTLRLMKSLHVMGTQ